MAWQECFQALDSSRVAQTAIVEDRRTQELKIALSVSRLDRTVQAQPFGEWIMDLSRFRTERRPLWTVSGRTITGYVSCDGPETASSLQNVLYSYYNAITNTVRTAKESTGYSVEFGKPTWVTRALSVGAHAANWLDMRGEYEPSTAATALTIESWVDGSSLATVTVALSSAAASSVYDTRRTFYTPLPLGRAGRSCGFRISADAAARLSNIEVGFVPEPRPRQFSR